MQFAKLYWYIAVPGIYYSIRGVCPPGRGMFHVLAKTGHTNLCGVVGCFRGEKPPLREVGSPEQSRRHLRRPLAQPRPSAAPQKKLRPSQTRVFIPLLCTCPCVTRILQNNTTAGRPGGLTSCSPRMLLLIVLVRESSNPAVARFLIYLLKE